MTFKKLYSLLTKENIYGHQIWIKFRRTSQNFGQKLYLFQDPLCSNSLVSNSGNENKPSLDKSEWY